MSSTLKDRAFPFEGGDLAYIEWLEDNLIAAKNLGATLSTDDTALPLTPESIPGENSEQWRFVYCSPSSSGSESSGTPRPFAKSNESLTKARTIRGVKKLQWERELNNFIQLVPPADNWQDRRAACGITTARSNHLALRIMLGEGNRIELGEIVQQLYPPHIQPKDDKSTIIKGCKYGMAVSNCSSTGQLAVVVAKYQKLIFISYCVVLLSTGNSKSTVNWMMKQYISDSDDKNLERYRAGCLWVNRCVSSLLEQGWGYKSWEVFFLCAKQPHQYGRFSDGSNSATQLLGALGSSATPIYEDGWIPYAIPCIVKVLFGDAVE